MSEQINQVRKQRNQVMGQYQQAEVQTYIAEKELTEYYRLEKEKTEVGLSQQLDQLEMRIFRFAEQFDRLKNQIGLYEENLGLAQKLYDHAVTAFNEGTATAERMEQARLGLLDAELQLLGAQKDYLILKEEFRLFKEGL